MSMEIWVLSDRQLNSSRSGSALSTRKAIRSNCLGMCRLESCAVSFHCKVVPNQGAGAENDFGDCQSRMDLIPAFHATSIRSPTSRCVAATLK
jgi:hypothetical protein